MNTLGEGIDLPIADVCCFARTKTSEISIVQCIGRILRKHPMKKMAHVIIPMQFSGNIIDNNFLKFLRKLARNDPVFIDYIKHEKTGRLSLVNLSANSSPEFEKTIDYGEQIYELLLDKEGQLLSDTWIIRFEQYAEYYRINNKFPGRSDISDGINLGYWFDDQKKIYKNGRLLNSRIEKLDSIDISWKNIKLMNKEYIKMTWNDISNLLKEYKEEFGKMPKFDTIYKNIPIGQWLNDRKNEYKRQITVQESVANLKPKTKLTIDQINVLNTIDNKWNDVKTINSTSRQLTHVQKVEILIQYKNEFSKLPSSNQDYGGFNLGKWLNDQKQKYKDDPIKYPIVDKELLDSVDIKWYITKTNDGKIRRFITLNNRRPKSNEMFESIPIGQWLGN